MAILNEFCILAVPKCGLGLGLGLVWHEVQLAIAPQGPFRHILLFTLLFLAMLWSWALQNSNLEKVLYK